MPGLTATYHENERLSLALTPNAEVILVARFFKNRRRGLRLVTTDVSNLGLVHFGFSKTGAVAYA